MGGETAAFSSLENLTNLKVCRHIERIKKISILKPSLKLIYRNHIESHDPNQFICYTDGSKTEDGVAFVMTGRQPNRPPIIKSNRMHNNTSIFSADLSGIHFAAFVSSQSETIVFTDSRSSVDLLFVQHLFVQRLFVQNFSFNLNLT